MGLMDDMQDKAKDALNDPDNRDKIQQLAKDKGLSLEEAKEHFEKHKKAGE